MILKIGRDYKLEQSLSYFRAPKNIFEKFGTICHFQHFPRVCPPIFAPSHQLPANLSNARLKIVFWIAKRKGKILHWIFALRHPGSGFPGARNVSSFFLKSHLLGIAPFPSSREGNTDLYNILTASFLVIISRDSPVLFLIAKVDA